MSRGKSVLLGVVGVTIGETSSRPVPDRLTWSIDCSVWLRRCKAMHVPAVFAQTSLAQPLPAAISVRTPRQPRRLKTSPQGSCVSSAETSLFPTRHLRPRRRRHPRRSKATISCRRDFAKREGAVLLRRRPPTLNPQPDGTLRWTNRPLLAAQCPSPECRWVVAFPAEAFAVPARRRRLTPVASRFGALTSSRLGALGARRK